MPDDIQQGEMPNQPNGETPEGTPEPTAAELKAELERAREALRVANSEAADRRRKLEAFERAENERKQSEMSELEKLKAAREDAERRAAEAEQRANQRLIEAAFVAEASKVGAKYPEDVYALANKSAVTIGEDGRPVGVAEAVKALADAGRLVMGTPRAPGLDSGAGGGTRPDKTVVLTAEEEAMARKMRIKPEDYAKQKQQIQKDRTI